MSGCLRGEEKLSAWANALMRDVKADQSEVSITASQSALTRFANSSIHQNIAECNVRVGLRAVFGKKVVSVTTNLVGEEDMRKSLDDVVRMALLQGENQDFVSLPSPDEGGEGAYFESTAESTPEQRAEIVRAVVGESDKVDGSAAGSMATSAFEQAVANSLGVSSYYRSTTAQLLEVVTGPDGGFGYASAHASDIADIDGRAVGEEAAKGARASRNPVSLEPGAYECVLLPYAMEDMLGMLLLMGFYALSYQEGRSCISGKMGKQIASTAVNIWDDGHDPRTIKRPFDREGVPKQRVDLIRDGIASGVLYDSYTAHREGRKSTGHASGSNILMKPGDATVDEMIAGTKRGLLVTRFNYTNAAHLMTSSFTGMTRDGTFLIENGQIVAPVKNLRFTQSILEVLSGVEAIGKDLKLVDNMLVPAVKVSKFHFSSSTEF